MEASTEQILVEPVIGEEKTEVEAVEESQVEAAPLEQPVAFEEQHIATEEEQVAAEGQFSASELLYFSR